MLFGRLRGRRKPKGKGWNREEGSVGAVVGCLWVCVDGSGKKNAGELWSVWLAVEKGECRGSEWGR